MHNDPKPDIRIIAERVSVTTIRTLSEKIYCEICRRELRADEIRLAAFAARDTNDTGMTAEATEYEKEK